MLEQVELKIQELQKAQAEEYYKKKEADLRSWGLVSKKEKVKLPNLVEFKKEYLGKFNSFDGDKITIGLPRVLNFYDTLPFWFTFFKEMGFSVRVSKSFAEIFWFTASPSLFKSTVCDA